MAKGLYAQLSCGLPDKPEIIDAGPEAELVYYRAILRSRAQLTDGVIDRRLVARWFAGIRRPTAHLDRLTELGMIELHEAGWCIPITVWQSWNPTQSDVDVARQRKIEAGAAGNHKRWHTESDPNPKCRHCSEAGWIA